jgi:hypothetical protein
MADLPTFRVIVVGTTIDPALVERKLGELLARKLTTYRVILHAGGSVRLPVAVFGMWHNLAVELIPDPSPHDTDGTYWNTELLWVGRAFLLFGRDSDWPVDVADLVRRGKSVGLNVRVVETVERSRIG